MENRNTITQNIRNILTYIGEDVEREGLKDTPERIIKSWDKLYGGYKQDYKKILSKQFYEGKCDQMVILKDIEFYSTCEHHMIPFSGRVHIGYIPSESVVGISKLARLVEVFSRRLQIQERMTEQIADAIDEVLKPKGVIVIVEGRHLCMIARGVEKQNSTMTTSAIRGVFNKSESRNEFLQLVKI